MKTSIDVYLPKISGTVLLTHFHFAIERGMRDEGRRKKAFEGGGPMSEGGVLFSFSYLLIKFLTTCYEDFN